MNTYGTYRYRQVRNNTLTQSRKQHTGWRWKRTRTKTWIFANRQSAMQSSIKAFNVFIENCPL